MTRWVGKALGKARERQTLQGMAGMRIPSTDY